MRKEEIGRDKDRIRDIFADEAILGSSRYIPLLWGREPWTRGDTQSEVSEGAISEREGKAETRWRNHSRTGSLTHRWGGGESERHRAARRLIEVGITGTGVCNYIARSRWVACD